MPLLEEDRVDGVGGLHLEELNGNVQSSHDAAQHSGHSTHAPERLSSPLASERGPEKGHSTCQQGGHEGGDEVAKEAILQAKSTVAVSIHEVPPVYAANVPKSTTSPGEEVANISF